MKISIITLLNVTNYGSVLQTYATKEILERKGYQVEFVDFLKENQTDNYKKNETLKNISKWNILKKLYQKYIGIPTRLKKSKQVFRKFVEDNIPLTKQQYLTTKELKNNPPIADIFCTGSDQMWNSNWNGGVEKAFFLDYAKDKPKIALSTSFGMNEIPISEEKITIDLIKKYSYITLRENEGVELLKKYDISSECTLDPTLILNKEFWKKFSDNFKHKNYAKEKYILIYQLNKSHDNVDFTKYVKKLSEKMKLPVKVICYGVPRKKIFDDYILLPSIEEFVALFINSNYIITDSFHGTAFAINLNIPLSVIMPEKFSGRLKNILSMCSLESRILKNNKQKIEDEKINYSDINKILDQKREESLRIFDKALKLTRLEIENSKKQ